MRLIDADALRAAMYHEAFETDSDLQRWDAGCWIRWRMFEKMLDAAPTIAEKDDGWHDAKTDPPTENGVYLALYDGDIMDFWFCSDGEFGFDNSDEWISAEDCGVKITHWMYKPELPKDGEQE